VAPAHAKRQACWKQQIIYILRCDEQFGPHTNLITFVAPSYPRSQTFLLYCRGMQLARSSHVQVKEGNKVGKVVERFVYEGNKVSVFASGSIITRQFIARSGG
jgi:hypothetical protein